MMRTHADRHDAAHLPNAMPTPDAMPDADANADAPCTNERTVRTNSSLNLGAFPSGSDARAHTLTSLDEALDSLFGGDPAERMTVVRSGERDPIDPWIRRAVYLRDGGRCRWCGVGSDYVQLVLDHIVPWSAGGSDRSDNLRMLCWGCNERRSNYRTDAGIARVLPVAEWCTRCSGYYQRPTDLDDYEIDAPEPLELADPVAAFCGHCRFAGIADRVWTA